MNDHDVLASSVSSTDKTISNSSLSSSIFTNYPLIASLVAFTLAQSTKFFTTWTHGFNVSEGVGLATLLLGLGSIGFGLETEISCSEYKEKRWDIKLLVASGGMPSSHSATVTALAFSIGFQDGFGGSLFAIAMILACIVMYDATGVRLHAGRQAEVLNQIVYELPPEHPLSDTRPLRELLGHTPPQVIVGGLLGLVIAIIAHLISKLTIQA